MNKILESVLTIFVGREAVGWVKQHAGLLRRVLLYSAGAFIILFSALLVYGWYVLHEFSGAQPYCVKCALGLP